MLNERYESLIIMRKNHTAREKLSEAKKMPKFLLPRPKRKRQKEWPTFPPSVLVVSALPR